MSKVNYSQIYAKLTKGLSPKTKDIFDRRFGVKTPVNVKGGKGQTVQIETLESIGEGLGITRERVRQIEEAGFNFIRKNHKETLNAIFSEFNAYFDKKGGFQKEETALEDLGGVKGKPYVLFLLSLGKDFSRVSAKKDYHYFWVGAQTSEQAVKDHLNVLVSDITKHGKLLGKDELFATVAPKYQLNEEKTLSYIAVSKRIQQNKEGKFGLVEWPEIKPRGVKDKAFLVFQESKKPLHFREITGLIDKLGYNQLEKKTHPQTVHNELIKDSRFVLVGRGMYALSEWGYVPGTIKDIITKVLEKNQEALHQDEIVKEVLSQRFVAKNTVLINLNNKKHFTKNEEGKYFLRETLTA